MNPNENLEIQVLGCSIRNRESVKLLGIHIDNNLNFDCHFNQPYKKAIEKLHSFAKIGKYMDINKRRMLMKTFLSSLFSYCSLILMFHSKKMEHRISSIRNGALKLAYENFLELTFHELLAKEKLLSVHQKH